MVEDPPQEGAARSNGWKGELYRRYTSGQVLQGGVGLGSQIAARAPYCKRVIERFLPADRNRRILDLGCGYGAFLSALQQSGYARVVGVDASPEQVSTAHTLGSFEIYCEDLLGFIRKQPNEAFDVVLAIDVLEHFERAELIEVVMQVRRVLAANGSLLLHVPNAEAIASGAVRYGDLTHELAFTQASLRQLAHACGFDHVACFEDSPIIHGAVSLVRSMIWKLFTSPIRLLRMAETGCRYSAPILSQNLLAVLSTSDPGPAAVRC